MIKVVPGGGFEPPRVTPHAPQTCASAKFRHPGPKRLLRHTIVARDPYRAPPLYEPREKRSMRWRGASARGPESYNHPRSRGVGVRPGILPRLASGLPFTSRRSIVMSIGGAALT